MDNKQVITNTILKHHGRTIKSNETENAEQSTSMKNKNKNSNPGNGPSNLNLEGVPIDKGWAWAVLSGCVLYMLIFGGLMRSFGVFFLQFQERFKANASEVAFMNLIQNIIVSITGLLVMTVGMKKLSCRTVVAIGGLLNALGYIISGFAKDIRVFYFSHGLLCGTGMAMLHPPMLAMIGVYFNKHRGLANSIFTGSGAVGGLIFAPVVTSIFQEYGYTGALLFFSGLLFNGFVSAALLRPPQWFTKHHKKQAVLTKDEASEPLMSESKTIDKPADILLNTASDQNKQTLEHEYEIQDKTMDKHRIVSNGVGKSVMFERTNSFEPRAPSSPALMRVRAWSHGPWSNVGTRHRNLSGSSEKQQHGHSRIEEIINALDGSKSAMYASGEGIFSSVVNLHAVSGQDESNKANSNEKKTVTNCCLSFKTGLYGILDCKLFRNIAFTQYLFMAFVTLPGMALVPVYIPAYAKDNGLSYNQIAIMLSVMAALDLVTKIASGIIADRKWLRRTTILGTAAFSTGTMCHLTRFFTSFPLIMTLALIMACFYGLYNAMFSTILIDVIGMAKFQSSLGFVTLVHGVAIAIFFPVSGLIRDLSGSYVYALHLCGLLSYAGAALLFLLPVVQRKLKSPEDETKQQPV